MAVDCGPDVVFDGKENISIYDTGDWAERGFCKACGSHLFYRQKASRQHMIPAGQFDDQSSLVFDHQIFVDKNPGFYRFANKTTEKTEAEVFAQHAPK